MSTRLKDIWDVVSTCLIGLVLWGASAVFIDKAFAVPITDPRYCGPPARDAKGEIIRSQAVLRQFQKLVPCPSTKQKTGKCPGWAKDHVRPLAACGCDSIVNLQWLKDTIKHCKGPECKDNWERWVYTCEQGG